MSYESMLADAGVDPTSIGTYTRKKKTNPLDMIPYLGQGLGILGSVIGAGKTQAQKNAEAALPGLQNQMQQGIGLGSVGEMAPLAANAAMPEVNAIASTMGSRFGRSGYAKGAAVSGLTSSLSPQILAMLKERLLNNQQNLRQLYSTNAQIAAGA